MRTPTTREMLAGLMAVAAVVIALPATAQSPDVLSRSPWATEAPQVREPSNAPEMSEQPGDDSRQQPSPDETAARPPSPGEANAGPEPSSERSGPIEFGASRRMDRIEELNAPLMPEPPGGQRPGTILCMAGCDKPRDAAAQRGRAVR